MNPWKQLRPTILALTLTLAGLSAAGEEPFDYFRNSWQVLGLRDYPHGTRITPENQLVLDEGVKVRLLCGSNLMPLSRKPTKTLLESWLPVVLLQTELDNVRYEFALWSTPLPTVKDWRAAFNGPTEGDNFLNWVQVKATNVGSIATQALVRMVFTATNRPALPAWSVQLAPGERADTAWRIPYAPVPEPGLYDHEEASVWRQRTVEYWQSLLAGGARLEVPCSKATAALKAAHVCQLIASDRGELHAGEGFYDEFYIRDGGYQLLELEEAGLWDAAQRGVEVYLKFQRPDGRFESQKDQLDANGQALWTLWQYWRITGDTNWLRRVYPPMRRAVEWLITARRAAPADSPFAGVLPTAVADGEFLWDGRHHIVGYDLWNLRGLLCTADAALALGNSTDAARYQREATAYREDIDAAWKRTGLTHFPPSWEQQGTPWGNTETLWPTELFSPEDPRVTATMAEVRERHGGGSVEGTIRWTGQPGVIHPYLSSYTTMASLIRGDHERFAEEFYWYLLHSSASHAFPEGIYFKRRYAWSETIPHALGAANFAFLLRHALVHERGSELHLLAGTPDWWLAAGREIRVERAPTHFGPLDLIVRGRNDGVELDWQAPRRQPPDRVVLHLPKPRQLLNAVAGVAVTYRADQSRRWDLPTVIQLYEEQSTATAKPIPALVALPISEPLLPARCEFLELAPLANTNPLEAPFGVSRPGKYVFTGWPAGVQRAAGIPFRLTDVSANKGRGLVVLQGSSACASFPREVEIPVHAPGRRLYFLGNVHGWNPDDEGAGDWGAVAEYVIHYADGQTQTVPLISHRTADDWASPPTAVEVTPGLQGDPWHLNVLGVNVRPVRIQKIVFRDLGTPAAPVLVAVTLEQ